MSKLVPKGPITNVTALIDWKDDDVYVIRVASVSLPNEAEWCIYASATDAVIGACSAPSHYLSQCWIIVKWIFRNQLLWYFDRNSNTFIQEKHLKVKWRLQIGVYLHQP